jgi:hypothetical protein
VNKSAVDNNSVILALNKKGTSKNVIAKNEVTKQSSEYLLSGLLHCVRNIP